MCEPTLVFRKFNDGFYNISLLKVFEKNKSKKLFVDETRYDMNQAKKALYYDYEFHIYELNFIVDENDEYDVEYYFEGEEKKYKIKIPSMQSKLNLIYTSCNEKCDDMKNNWKKVLDDIKKPHILIGGGDQVYADDVFKLESIKKLIEIYKNKPNEFLDYECNDEIKIEIEKFYINLYLEYHNTEYYSEILSTIPSINICDDHEIFDGYGSYNDYIQKSKLVNLIYESAYKFYLLFQHNIIDYVDKFEFGYFGEKCFNKIYKFNDSVIIGLDHRAERTRIQLFTEDTFNELTDKIKIIKNNYQNYIYLVGIPLFFPHNETIEKIIKLGEKNKIISKLLKSIGGTDCFGNFEGDDDVVYDSWNCNEHINDKYKIIDIIFNSDDDKNKKLIALSGDSHLGGLSKCELNGKTLYHFMCSGIGSINPTQAIGNFVELSLKKSSVKYEDNESVVSFIKFDKNYIIKCRNWMSLNFEEEFNCDFYCEIEQNPYVINKNTFLNTSKLDDFFAKIYYNFTKLFEKIKNCTITQKNKP